MSYHIEMIEDGKAMLVTNDPDFDFAVDGPAVIGDVMVRLDALNEPVFYVVDLRELNISFDETQVFVNMLTRGDNPLLQHKNIKEIIYIIGTVIHQIVAQGMSTEAFGNLQSKTFADMDDTLKYIRGQ